MATTLKAASSQPATGVGSLAETNRLLAQGAATVNSSAPTPKGRDELPAGIAYQTYNPDGSVRSSETAAQKSTQEASDISSGKETPIGVGGEITGAQAVNPVSSAPIAPPTAVNTPVSTAQPNPTTVNATPYTNTSQPASGTGADLSAAQQGHAAAVASGAVAPQNAGIGMSAATTAMSNANTGYASPAPVVQAYTDATQKLTDDYNKAMSSQDQGKSLVEQYQDFTKQLGIPELNTQLMNMKNVIDGTEDDIRNEVTKAGGFATDSQVLAMTNARNKTMIQNYNNLLQTRSDMQQQVTTMVGLAAQDRTFLNQQIDRQLNFDQAQVSFADKALTNAQQSIQQSIATYGAASVLKQAQATGDPTAVARINATLGNNFDLATAAAQPTLDEQLKTAQIAAANRANRPTAPSLQFVQGSNGNPSGTFNPATGVFTPISGGNGSSPQTLAQTQQNIQLTTSLATNKNLAGAVAPNAVDRFNPIQSLTGQKQNFIAGVKQITDQLTLDSLTRAKQNGATFGALSDGERDVLASSATKLGSWAVKDKSGNITGYNIDKKDFTAELDKINNFAKLDYVLKGGDPSAVGVIPQQDGTYWTKNSDGSYTKIQ